MPNRKHKGCFESFQQCVGCMHDVVSWSVMNFFWTCKMWAGTEGIGRRWCGGRPSHLCGTSQCMCQCCNTWKKAGVLMNRFFKAVVNLISSWVTTATWTCMPNVGAWTVIGSFTFDIVSWNAILGGYVMHGYANRSSWTFPADVWRMCRDDVTFVSLLSTCSCAALTCILYIIYSVFCNSVTLCLNGGSSGSPWSSGWCRTGESAMRSE